MNKKNLTIDYISMDIKQLRKWYMGRGTIRIIVNGIRLKSW